MSRKTVVATGVVLVLGATGAALLARPTPVTVVEVGRREIVERLIVSGRVLAPSRVDVSPVVAGTVTQVSVNQGDRISRGTLLAQLRDDDARAGLKQARAGLAVAEARLAQSTSVARPLALDAHKQADANLKSAELHFERVNALVGSGAATQAQLDEATRALTAARAQHDTAEAQVASTRTGGADHRLALAGFEQAAAQVALAQVRLDQTRITAPIDALVLERDVEPGELVQPGRVIFALVATGATELLIAPDERNLATLKLGQRAVAAADAFPKDRFEAVVSRIAPGVDAARGTVEVRLAVSSPPAVLRPDMTVSVDIEVGRKADALVLPSAAVYDLRGASPWVLLVTEGRVERRPVDLGLRGEGAVEVLSGLSERDLVALAGPRPLAEGTRVRPRPARSP